MNFYETWQVEKLWKEEQSIRFCDQAARSKSRTLLLFPSICLTMVDEKMTGTSSSSLKLVKYKEQKMGIGLVEYELSKSLLACLERN